MNFNELEALMSSRGITTLAEIARVLTTTPQAVSNWKARDQVPHRVAAKLSQVNLSNVQKASNNTGNQSVPILNEKYTISLSDILLIIAEQLKVILLTTFIFVFLTFTYVAFIQQLKFVSYATVLLPESKLSSLGGLSGLASTFGVSVPMESRTDLSSPSLYPDLLLSRTFAEQILDKEFYLNEYGKKLSLLAITTYGDKEPRKDQETLISQAVKSLREEYLAFNNDPGNSFSVIEITASEPLFAKELADIVLKELESLNRYFKSVTVNEKISFIEDRIISVEDDLKATEMALKDFNENNRQISSPALLLEQERLQRDTDVQKEVYLTLKQQLELAKIEEIQEASVVQVLDRPTIALKPSNKNLTLSLVLSFIFGGVFGILLGFFRAYLDNEDIEERKKIRRIKRFLIKKLKDTSKDTRITGVVSGFLLIGLPFFLGTKSSDPIFFGMYSTKYLIVNILYLFILSISSILFIRNRRKKIKK